MPSHDSRIGGSYETIVGEGASSTIRCVQSASFTTFRSSFGTAFSAPTWAQLAADAELALVSLGFRKAEAKHAITQALASAEHDATLEMIVRDGLRRLAPKQS